jgi:hypothetical protein
MPCCDEPPSCTGELAGVHHLEPSTHGCMLTLTTGRVAQGGFDLYEGFGAYWSLPSV